MSTITNIRITNSVVRTNSQQILFAHRFKLDIQLFLTHIFVYMHSKYRYLNSLQYPAYDDGKKIFCVNLREKISSLQCDGENRKIKALLCS